MNPQAAGRQPEEADGDSSIHPQTSPSFEITYHGGLSLVRSQTRQARQWLGTHCPAGEEHTYFSGALVVESRYLANLTLLARQDGLHV